jgi:hypothetical protein
MSTTQNLIAYGSFISDGNARTISIPSGVSYFEIENRSTYGTAPAAIVKSWWQTGMANNTAMQWNEAAGTSILSAVAAATNGIAFVQSPIAPGAASAITAITNATPAVVSSATTPLVGDIVRIYGTTGMLQASSLDYTVTAVNPGVTFTLGYLPAGAGQLNFLAAATAGFWRRVADYQYYPRKRFVTFITQAAQAVVTLSVTHGYVVGEKVTIYLPDARFGMTEINGLTGTIQAVNPATNTVTLDIDSTAFTAFTYPTSAQAAAGCSFPNMVPAGEVATILTGAFSDQGFRGLYLGTAVVGANTNVMQWRAYKGEALPS